MTPATSPVERSRPGAGSVTWKLHREVVLLAGWGRAILLQLAHPLVAEGVARHSEFRHDRWGGVRRLRHTIRAMLALTFGSAEEAGEAAARINAIHDRVHGQTAERLGCFPEGTGYSAHDPALLAWVHATLLDSFLQVYQCFVEPLAPEERDRYCAEAAHVGPVLGIPARYLPSTERELSAYMAAMIRNGEICVTPVARTLARHILERPLPAPLGWLAGPAIALARLPTVGLLPVPIREGYGLSWTRGRERALWLLAAAVRGGLGLAPSVARCWPAARAAERRAAGRRGVTAGGAASAGPLRSRPGSGTAGRPAP